MSGITWLGHATALVSVGGARVLIDPLGRRRCRALPAYRAVLVTHAHPDHLNRWTLSTLDLGAEVVVPRGAGRLVGDLGFAGVREVVPGDRVVVGGGVEVAAVPTRHDPGRWRRRDGGPGCVGYVIGGTVYHAGDIDMSDHTVFDDIGAAFRLDAALLPIGGLLPVWYYRARTEARDRGVHIDPDTALDIAARLRVTAMVPVHWGTVHMRLGRPGAPRRRLERVAVARGVRHLVRVLPHGGTLTL